MSQQASSLQSWLQVLPLVGIFSLVSSSGYLINDLHNRHEDRKHPRKCTRPIAAGQVSVTCAVIIAVALYLIAFGACFCVYGLSATALCVAGYVLLNLSYTFILRKIVLLDVIAISFGFVLRVAAGAYAVGLTSSLWLMGMTYLLALLLGLGKRTGEVRVVRKSQAQMGETRGVLRLYQGDLSVCAVIVLASVLFFTYLTYCCVVQDGFPFIITCIPVGVGLSSYVRKAAHSKEVETPENMLTERSYITASFLAWVLLTLYILY